MQAKITNRIELETGTEGPYHDPYGFTEITVHGRNGRVQYHNGLAEWIKLNGHVIQNLKDPVLTGDGYAVMGAPDWVFEQLTGITPRVAERTHHRQFFRMVRDHWLKCRAPVTKQRGFPGEYFIMCAKCNHILKTEFNIKEVE